MVSMGQFCVVSEECTRALIEHEITHGCSCCRPKCIAVSEKAWVLNVSKRACAALLWRSKGHVRLVALFWPKCLSLLITHQNCFLLLLLLPRFQLFVKAPCMIVLPWIWKRQQKSKFGKQPVAAIKSWDEWRLTSQTLSTGISRLVS